MTRLGRSDKGQAVGHSSWGLVRHAAAATVLLALTGGSASALDEGPTGVEIVLNGEDNRLNGYDAATGAKATVIPSAADAADGLDINAEICAVPDGVPWKPAGEVWIIAGEDTEQNAVAGVIRQGWGLFRLTGTTLAELRAEEVGKLVPDSFVTAADNPENYGCGVLPDGRIVTGDVGDQLPTSPATGQLIVWYPTASHFTGSIGPERTDFARVPHCKIDVGIGTAGGFEVDGTDLYLASNRPNLATLELGGIYRYDTTTWPTGEVAADGCGRTDATGQQLADADRVGKQLFIPQVAGLVVTPSDIVDSGRGTFYVSSVFTGQIAEYARSGQFLRFVVNTTGQLGGITPYGIGVTSDGTLWVADIGVAGPGPAPAAGSVVRVRFDADGNPGAPEVVDDGLEFPDGIGVVTLPAAPTPSATPSNPATPDAPMTPTPSSGRLPATGATVPMTAVVLAVLSGFATVGLLHRAEPGSCPRAQRCGGGAHGLRLP